MILSVSRRTDIPCYYSEWLINRLKAGYVLTRNPFNHAQLSRIPLSPDAVDCIVFWTKDAQNMTPHLKTIDEMGYPYYFQWTITPYDRTVEPNLRDKSKIEDAFIALSAKIGKERMIWRYDPIIINDRITVDDHKKHFERLCQKLSPHTDRVTISFVDDYAKLKTPLVRALQPEEMAELSAFIGKTAHAYGLVPTACCEKADLTPYGIQKASCIDKSLLEKICKGPLALKKDRNQREHCGCVESTDIGAYNTCINNCIYCYANHSPLTAKGRYDKHNPEGELLFGTVNKEETVIDRKVKSNLTESV